MARLYRDSVGVAASAGLARLAAVLGAAALAASLAAARAPSSETFSALAVPLAAALAVLLAAALSCAHTTPLSGLGTLLSSTAPTRALRSLFPRLLPPLLRGPRVFLRDFSCWRPPLLWFVDSETVMQTIELSDRFDDEASVFMRRICERSGLGPATAMSPGIIAMRTEGGRSTCVNIAGGAAGGAIGEAAKGVQLGRAGLQDALDETKVIMFEVCRDLFEKTGISPTDIDAVFTSCSCFAPTPSMAAMIVNEFGMRRDVLTYSLAGMGCSSSLVCVDAAMHMLRGLPKGSRVLIVNHENITANWYDGRDRSMLVTNCLFRAGGAAAIMTNFADARNKYELLDSERTHAGRDDDAFGCMGTGVDDDGVRGVFLKSNVVEVAGRALGHMLERLGPRALPASELLKAAASRAKAALSSGSSSASSARSKKGDDVAASGSADAGAGANNKLYTPDFSKAFDHFVLHTGGQAVLDALQRALGLSDAAMAPSRDTLHRYGNTSSASTWYTLAHCEAGVGLGLDGGVPFAGRRAARAAKEAALAGKDGGEAAGAAAGGGDFAPVAVPRRRVGVRKGDRALQLGFGGGFKACGALWRATRDITEAHPVWEEGFVDMPAVHANVARQLAEADAREAAREAEASARARLTPSSSKKLFGGRPLSAKSVLE